MCQSGIDEELFDAIAGFDALLHEVEGYAADAGAIRHAHACTTPATAEPGDCVDN